MKIIVYLLVIASVIMFILAFYAEPGAEASPFLLVAVVLTLYARLAQASMQHTDIKRLLGEVEETHKETETS